MGRRVRRSPSTGSKRTLGVFHSLKMDFAARSQTSGRCRRKTRGGRRADPRSSRDVAAVRTRGHHLAGSRSCQTRRARRSHARKTARRTCCWFAPGWRYSVRSCKIWSMPACCGCHMGGGGGAAMVSPPRPSRVSFDRSSRSGDGQTIGSRLVNGGTVRRRAPLAVTPGRLNRSPIRVSKTGKLVDWRAARVSGVLAPR